MKKGLIAGTLLFGIDQQLFRGKAPWTLRARKPDHEATEPKEKHRPIDYPKPDGVLSFDRLPMCPSPPPTMKRTSRFTWC